MKKFITDIRTLAALLMAGAAFIACSSSDDNIIDEQPVNPAQKTYTLTVNASKGDGAQTRALNLTGKTLTASWATTENVYVKKESTWATGSLQPETAGTTATLKGSLRDIEINASDVLTLQFPNSGTISYAGQVGTLEDIAANFDYATATVTVADVSATGNIIPEEATTTFTNQQAIIKFTLKDKANEAAISPSAFTVSDGTCTVELTGITDATYYDPKNGAGVLYVAFPAAGSAKTITLTATVGDDLYTYTTSSAKTFVNGQYYEITVKMTKQVIPDLSMVDCAGNARPSRWTANCYMVHKAGVYKLPLVYGNAIKADADNTEAYKPGETTSTNYCANFVNHAGTAINAPWITKSPSGEGVNKGMGITVTQAELLWQDAQWLITDVRINGDYLMLTVDKDADKQEGNAVIAVKDTEGTIVWSWHIWVTKQTFATLTEVNTGSHTYRLTPVNLGWVGDAASAIGGYNTYYQWGRKDAFIPSNPIPSTGTGDTNHTVYNISNATVTGISFTQDNSNSVTIGGNIQNPTVHYNTSTNGPCNSQFYNMWDAQQTSIDIAAAATVKTVYDPCPPGFCVPTIGLYDYIKNQTRPTWNTGYTYSGVFFPASGYRISNSGVLDLVGTNGYCWSATPLDGTDGRYFKFVYDSWGLGSYGRALGCPVRAVAE